MRIGIVGYGVVGKATAKFFSQLNSVDILIHDKDVTKSTISVSGLRYCDLVCVCLPTPTKRGELALDVSALDEFFDFRLGSANTEDKMRNVHFVLRSTVPIGTTRRMATDHGLRFLCHWPEFLTMRTADHDTVHPRMHVVGQLFDCEKEDGSGDCADRLRNLLDATNVLGVPNFLVSAEESEAVKLAQNSFSAVKIAFFNELRTLLDRNGCQYGNVLRALLAQGWINPMHTQVPGPDGKFGFGGECLPKDLSGFVAQLVEANLGCQVSYGALTRNEFDRSTTPQQRRKMTDRELDEYLKTTSLWETGMKSENAIRSTIVIPAIGVSIEVEEVIFYNFDPSKESPNKLVWCRKPFDSMVVGGLPNMLFHQDFPVNNGPQSAHEAREVIRQEFCKWYHL